MQVVLQFKIKKTSFVSLFLLVFLLSL